LALWDIMRLAAISGGVAGGVAFSMGGSEATLARWVAGAVGLVLGGISLPLTNALSKKVTSERGLSMLYGAVFFGTMALCAAVVILVHQAIAP
jgi:hypothetical protein